MKTDLSGNLITSVAPHLDGRGRGIAVDAANNHVYFGQHSPASSGAGTIWRANADGSGGLIAIVTGLQRPRDLVLDLHAGKILWVDESTRKIQSANLDGTGLTDIVTGLDGPSSLTLLASTSAPDNDGDGTPNASDDCPNEFGPPDNGGCPRPELPPGTEVSNPPSDCPIIVDGRFGSDPCDEWADVTPIVELGGQSIVYQVIAPGLEADGLEDLYLMYDCICSLTPQQPGDLTAVVTFFVGLDRFDVTIIQGGPNSTGELGDQTIVLRNGVLFDAPGIQGAVDFNVTSPNFPEPHNLVELEVPLLQTPETPGGLPPDQGGIYSPDPSFWGAQVAGSDLIQVSSNIIDIGSGEVVTSTVIPIVARATE